ncbi:MAG: PDZ domain-containing protein [Oscillospiraceae bacterium]|nr:PDZ domain-containing protein [Oscillospiraceae bacterium]
MKKRIAAAMCGLLFFALAPGVWADELLVGGQAVGIEIEADGVLVSGFCEVDTPEGAVSPAREAGFAVGDLIVKMDGAEIRSAEDLIAAVARLGGAESEMEILRGGKTQRLRVRPALSSSRQWLLGLWLRDGVSGIGTLTFIEPRSGVFGALGHSVNDENSACPVPLRAGQLCAAEIVSVSPGVPGTPGELCGGDTAERLGSVEKNTPAGIFGHVTAVPSGRLLQTGEMKTGRASIVSTLSGREAKEYDVEIDRVYSEGGQTHALLTVTDGALSSASGGIVQGMSGSPIIQDGSIVGAVTHVSVPT